MAVDLDLRLASIWPIIINRDEPALDGVKYTTLHTVNSHEIISVTMVSAE